MCVRFSVAEFVRLLRERALLDVSTWTLRHNLRLLVESGVVEEVIRRELQDHTA